jgi:hypothetical protein
MNILIFINNLIKYSNKMFTDFLQFIVENNLIGLFMASFLLLAVSQILSSIKINLIDYYLNKLFKTSDNNLIKLVTSFFQFILILIFLYFIYNYLIKPIQYRYIKRNTFDDVSWKKNLILELKEINTKLIKSN